MENTKAIVMFIEVKRKGGKHRAAQTAWINKAREDGVIAFFAESWEQVRDEIESHGIVLKVRG